MILKKLKKCLESEKTNKKIFDIIVYGSLVKGKIEARDIDILVIFLEGKLRERLDMIQIIKNKIKKNFDNIDIKQILLEDLFSKEFLARTGIFLEGISIFRDRKFCETLGFGSCSLFWYSLKGMTHSQKVKFNYVLAGRNKEGIIELFNGERLAAGVIKIPIQYSLEFEGILKRSNIEYKK